MTIHLIIPDPHAHPDHHNDRADWVGKLILDIKPDVVINMGDMFDMPSMNSFDVGKKSWGHNYKLDIDVGLDFDDRIWHPMRHAKKRKPFSIFLEGNHEHRMAKTLNTHPEMEGLIGFDDYGLENYHEVVRYRADTPGTYTIDGVTYAHYFISGVRGKPISSIHHAHAMVQKLGLTTTQGHSHERHFTEIVNINGTKRLGLVCGVYQDYDSDWAGGRNNLWWRGVVIKRNVEGGNYDHEWVSIKALKEAYG